MASCQDRTEVFARHLTSRLKNLGTQDHESGIPDNDSFLKNLDNGVWVTSNNFQNKNQCVIPSPAAYLKFNCAVVQNVRSMAEERGAEEEQYQNESNCSSCKPLIVTQRSLASQDTLNGLYNSNCIDKLNTTLYAISPSEKSMFTCPMQNHRKSTNLTQLRQNGIIEKEKEEKEIISSKNECKEEIERPQIEVQEKNEIKEPIITIETEAGIIQTDRETRTITKYSNQYSDDYEEDERPQRIRRCSSLKTGKTPPGTPSCKKIVRFADAFGLDLADIKTYLDDIPTIPLSAYEDLQVVETESVVYPPQLTSKPYEFLVPLFEQPNSLPNFIDIVKEKFVILENAFITDSINNTISGCVRVRNLDFHKTVHIRYSLDGWRNYTDLKASYMENSCDGFSDKFIFTLFGNSLQKRQRLEFAVRFQCKGQQYWDNNHGANYCFQCLSRPCNNVNSAETTAMSVTTTSSNVTIRDSHNFLNTLNPMVSEAWCNSFY